MDSAEGRWIMAWGIFIIMDALGQTEVNAWLQAYDILTDEHPAVTPNPELAKRFEMLSDALDFWKQVSPLHPTRLDGRPNRPLTVWSVEMRQLPDADDVIERIH